MTIRTEPSFCKPNRTKFIPNRIRVFFKNRTETEPKLRNLFRTSLLSSIPNVHLAMNGSIPASHYCNGCPRRSGGGMERSVIC